MLIFLDMRGKDCFRVSHLCADITGLLAGKSDTCPKGLRKINAIIVLSEPDNDFYNIEIGGADLFIVSLKLLFLGAQTYIFTCIMLLERGAQTFKAATIVRPKMPCCNFVTSFPHGSGWVAMCRAV